MPTISATNLLELALNSRNTNLVAENYEGEEELLGYYVMPTPSSARTGALSLGARIEEFEMNSNPIVDANAAAAPSEGETRRNRRVAGGDVHVAPDRDDADPLRCLSNGQPSRPARGRSRCVSSIRRRVTATSAIPISKRRTSTTSTCAGSGTSQTGQPPGRALLQGFQRSDRNRGDPGRAGAAAAVQCRIGHQPGRRALGSQATRLHRRAGRARHVRPIQRRLHRFGSRPAAEHRAFRQQRSRAAGTERMGRQHAAHVG